MQACDLSARLATTFAVTRWLLLKKRQPGKLLSILGVPTFPNCRSLFRAPFDHADRSSTPLAILLPFQPFLEVVWG